MASLKLTLKDRLLKPVHMAGILDLIRGGFLLVRSPTLLQRYAIRDFRSLVPTEQKMDILTTNPTKGGIVHHRILYV